MNEIFYLILWISIAYIFGSIPVGLILSKLLLKVDIRTIGSKNIGATNAFRVNKFLGVATFLLDALKGVIPVYLGSLVLPADAVYILSFTVVMGHIFPIWLKFKGGKGVATLFGTLIVLNPLVFLIAIIIWGLIFLLFRISSLASLCMLFFITIIVLFIGPWHFFVYMILISLFIGIKHKKNITNLMKGNERKFK